jgi:transcriptional regulator with XRE-family HTH domain
MVRGGAFIRATRKATGITQAFTAECYGVDVDTIGRWERLKIPVPFDDAVGILTSIFDMSLIEAMELANNENN